MDSKIIYVVLGATLTIAIIGVGIGIYAMNHQEDTPTYEPTTYTIYISDTSEEKVNAAYQAAFNSVNKGYVPVYMYTKDGKVYGNFEIESTWYLYGYQTDPATGVKLSNNRVICNCWGGNDARIEMGGQRITTVVYTK